MVQPRPAVVSIMADGSVMVTTAGIGPSNLDCIAMLTSGWHAMGLLTMHPLNGVLIAFDRSA